MYYQMTLNDWAAIKDSLRDDLRGVSQSFVRIGYKLRKIEEQRLYEQDGYKSLADFAKAEYGLSQSTTSRFMAINAKYSIGGYGENLRPEFEELGSSKLSEMLTLPDSDLEMITPETPREAIRELKSFEKAKPSFDGVELIDALIEVHEEQIREWYRRDMSIDLLKELLNPAGTRTFRKGVWFLLMYDADIKVKRFPNPPESKTWEDLAGMIRAVCGETSEEYEAMHPQIIEQEEAEEEEGTHEELAESRGLDEEPVRAVEKVEERGAEEKAAEMVEEPEEAEADAMGESNTGEDPAPVEEKEEYAPAHKNEPKQAEKAENEPVQEHAEVEQECKKVTRLEYMSGMTAAQLAAYIVRKHRERSISTLDLMAEARMRKWLTTLVDELGDEYGTD